MDFEEEKEIVAYILLEEMMLMFTVLMVMMVMMYATLHRHYKKYCLRDRTFVRHEMRGEELDRLIRGSEETGSGCVSTSVTQTSKSQPPTRKRVRNFDSVATSLKKMRSMIELYVESMDKRMGDVADRLGQAKNLSKDRRMIIEELRKLTKLSPREQIVVARKIAERPDYVDLFFSANNEYKQEFVAMLLEEGC